MKNIQRFVTLTLYVFVFLLFGCNVGLGPSVDLSAPTVTILTPENSTTVSNGFEVTGTAFDNIGVTELTLTCSKGSKIIQTFRNIDSKWQIKEGNSFVDYERNSNYEKTSDTEISWLLAVYLGEEGEVEDGEYDISVSATDEMGNSSSKSIAEISVRYDTNAPKVNINQPDVNNTKTYTATQTKYDSISNYKDSNIVNNFYSDDVVISGQVEEAFSIKNLELGLYLGTSTTPFYTTGVLTEENFSDVGSITGSLRSFNITVPKASFKSGGSPLTGKKYISIKAKAVDMADNGKDAALNSSETLGYFVWWPESNNPWIEVESLKTGNEELYGSMSIPISAYDNNGISRVSYRITNGGAEVSSGILYENDGTKNYESLISVSVDVPKDTGTYTLIVNAKDNNGLDATQISKQFKVKDVSRPSIEVTNKNELNCYGDSSGNIDFNLLAKDDSGISAIYVVYIKNQDDYGKYLDPNNSIWSAITPNNSFENDFVQLSNDSHGNKIWQIKPIDKNTVLEGQKQYEGNITLNIFSDLGIDGSSNTLNSQSFIFYAKELGSTDIKSCTADCTVAGDTVLPTVTITEFNLTSNGVTKTYKVNGSTITQNGTVVTTLPPVGENESISIKGTWNENSYDVWNNVNKLILELSISGNIIDSSKITINANKTWQTQSISLPNTSSVTVNVVIKDFAKNMAEAKFIKNREGISPSLTQIRVDKSQGNYSTGDTFTFSLKFNKGVRLANPSNVPSLTLHFDDSKTKVISLNASTDVKTEHTFATYTAQEGFDTSKLTVTLNLGSSVFVDANNNQANMTSYSKFYDDDAKIIAILTQPLKILNDYPKLIDNDSKIQIKFNQKINAVQNQNITVTQDTVYLPIVLNEDNYKELKNINSSFATTNYTEGLNGTDRNGNVDISTKYILNYNIEPDNTTLVNTYKTTGLHRRTYTMGSSCITIEGDTLTISLEEQANQLPVKGTSYTVNIPKGLVLNNVNNEINFVSSSKDYSITTSGCESPIIRIQNVKPTLNNYNGVQPLTTNVKIDCETPNANIYYKTSEQINAMSTNQNDNYRTNKTLAPKNNFPVINTAPNKTSTLFNAPFTLGKNGANSREYTDGIKNSIAAIAYNGDTASEVSYNAAFRTTFILNGGVDPNAYNGSNARYYLAGGDKIDGEVTTPGFPFSWNPSDGKAKIMTKDGNRWYFVTWDLNVTAYVKCLCGPTDTYSADYGPVQWGWSVNAFTSMVDTFPVFPGEVRYFNQSWNTDNGGFDFSPTVQGTRNDTVLGI